MIIGIIMTIVMFLIIYGIMWALFSTEYTKFNTTWGEPNSSWDNTCYKGVHTIKRKSCLDEWSLATANPKPLKITSLTSNKIVTEEHRKTMSYRNLTIKEANILKDHMKKFRNKQLKRDRDLEFNGNDTIVEGIPYGSINHFSPIINIDMPKPKGKAGNR